MQNKTFDICEVSPQQLIAFVCGFLLYSYCVNPYFGREIFAFEKDGKLYLAANSLSPDSPLLTFEAITSQLSIRYVNGEDWLDCFNPEEAFKQRYRTMIKSSSFKQSIKAFSAELPRKYQDDLKKSLSVIHKKMSKGKVEKLTTPFQPWRETLPSLFRQEAPFNFSPEKGPQQKITLSEDLIVKKVIAVERVKEKNTHLSKAVLGGQCYRILGNHYAESRLVGEEDALTIEQSLVRGDRLFFNHPERKDTELSLEEQTQLAQLAISSILLKDHDLAGQVWVSKENGPFFLGQNLMRHNGTLSGFDSGECFQAKEEYDLHSLLYLRHVLQFQSNPHHIFPENFLSWINSVVFAKTDDRLNEFLPEGLVKLRQFYQTYNPPKTEIFLYDLQNLSACLGEGKKGGSRLWECLKGLYQKHSKGVQLPSAFMNFFKSFPTEQDLQDYMIEVGKYSSDLIEMRPLSTYHKMFQGISQEVWGRALQEVLARVPQVEQYVSEVDLPERFFSREERSSCLKVLSTQKKQLEELCDIYRSKVGALESLPSPALSPVLGESLYYAVPDSELKEEVLAVMGAGAEGSAFAIPRPSEQKREFSGIFCPQYNAEKGLGRRLFKSSYSSEMASLKAEFDSGQVKSWDAVELKIMDIFARDLEEGKDPFNWKKLSNRMLWMFLMEAHFQREKEIQENRQKMEQKQENPTEISEISHAKFSAGSVQKRIWDKIFPEAQGRTSVSLMGAEPPRDYSISHGGAVIASDSVKKVAEAAKVFRQLRPTSSSFTGFLNSLSSDISAWKKDHIKWWHFGRRIFGVKGIRQVLKQLNDREANPAEMLEHIQQILKDRRQHKGPEDTRVLYSELAKKIEERAKIDQDGNLIEESVQAGA